MRPLRAFFDAVPPRLRGAIGALRWVVSRPVAAVQWLRRLRVDVWLAEGEELHSGSPLSVLCAVSEHEQKYLLELIFRKPYRRGHLGRHWLWNIAESPSATASACSLVILETDESHLKCALARSHNSYFIPGWVFGEVTLPRDPEATRKVNGDLRRIRRHGLQFEITRDPGQCDDFYNNMYVPYISKIFGDRAILVSGQRMQADMAFSDLLLIRNQEQTIAGQLLMHYESGSCFGIMGVRDGNRDNVKAGAACALYHYGFQYLQDQGHRKAWLGWSRPFLNDGVLQFKKKWSQRIVKSEFDGFVLTVVANTPGSTAFLCNNPFLFKRDGHFFGAVFLDAEQPPTTEAIEHIGKEFFHTGMARVCVHCLRQPPESTSSPTSSELPDYIELVSVSDGSKRRLATVT